MPNLRTVAVMLIFGGAIGYVIGNRQNIANSSLLEVKQQAVQQQGDTISQLNTTLKNRELQLATQQAAFTQLQLTLKEQALQLQGLKEQVAFFERIMRPIDEPIGVVIDRLTVEQHGTAGSYHYRLALIQPSKQRGLLHGEIQLQIEGESDNQPKTLTHHELGMTAVDRHYALRYFQVLEGVWQLPEKFTPHRIRVTIMKGKQQPPQQLLISWEEALKLHLTAPIDLSTEYTEENEMNSSEYLN